MKLPASLILQILFCLFAFQGYSQKANTASKVIVSPNPLPTNDQRKKIFLAGSIEMGSAEDWQKQVSEQLAAQPVVILNPRRADWNPAWKPEITDPHFQQQVEWELNALEKADLIIMYLAPGTQSPISLLELGLYAQSGKLLVCCPAGFWRKGNVDIVCEKYGIQQFESLPALMAALEKKLSQR